MIRIHFFIIFLIYTFLCSDTFSQQQNDIFSTLTKKDPKFGVIEIQQPVGVEQLMLSYISGNNKKTVEGYRIQVYFDNGRKAKQEAENVRAKLMNEFPSEKVSLEFDEPYWRVRVGYFRHKHEAIPLMRKLRFKYPNSFIVKVSNIKPENF